MRRFLVFLSVASLLALVVVAQQLWRKRSAQSVEDRVAEFEAVTDARWRPLFVAAAIPYPPQRVALIGLKDERVLQVYAASETGAFAFVRSFPILAASGGSGPKLREGDRQVPEGLYEIESLNPNSSYHLSLRVSYPNAWDREHGRTDGRSDLGGDIMIHGKAASIGCLAMGDPAAEDLFVLAARTGIRNFEVVLAPVDLRVRKFTAPDGSPAWTTELYERIEAALKKFPVAGEPATAPR